MEEELYTIEDKLSGYTYDTYDEKFYSNKSNPILDTKSYLEILIENNPDKFEDCEIVKVI